MTSQLGWIKFRLDIFHRLNHNCADTIVNVHSNKIWFSFLRFISRIYGCWAVLVILVYPGENVSVIPQLQKEFKMLGTHQNFISETKHLSESRTSVKSPSNMLCIFMSVSKIIIVISRPRYLQNFLKWHFLIVINSVCQDSLGWHWKSQ